MRDKIYYFATFNVEALLSLAEQIRGRKCTCDLTKMPKCGSLNWVIFITFDDGIEWVFRSPMHAFNHFYSDKTASKIVESEASTLMYLKAYTSIPVPEVYSYSGTSDNSIGVPYILQSKATGRSLGCYNWSQFQEPVTDNREPRPLLPLSDNGREKVMEQLGSIMAELSDHRFDKISSLFYNSNTGYGIGECLSPSLTWQERDSLHLNRGPYDQEHDYLASLVSAFISHAQELPLTPHIFYAPVPDELYYKTIDSHRRAARRWNDFVAIGQKICHSKNILLYCIVGQFLLEMIPHLSSAPESNFTLFHPDPHVGNIFVDDNLNITCIIDWSSASTGPITELLATPALGGSARPPSPSLTAAFRSGFCQRATRIAPDLSHKKLWQISDRMWHFTRLVRLLSRNDYEHFRQLFELTYEPSAKKTGIMCLLYERAQSDKNKKLLIELQGDDLTAEELQEKERRSFPPTRNANSDAITVARKLTLVSEMNPGFIADHVLWQWIEESLKRDAL